ncbi:nucleobase:cation symporter-2 family protein [Clostridium sediminicola]|uniref:uracil-xanthine permease family protein n=1 Tax=Clostridium sediminicola TaxID=3114879 RepID=UPI0031F2738A
MSKQAKYGLTDMPPVKEAVALSLQHVILFIAATVAVPLIVGGAIGFDKMGITFLLQCSLFTAGIGTMIQSFGVGPVGNRLPIIMGATFIFVGPCIALSNEYGYASFLGASLVCGLIVGFVGPASIKVLRKIFPTFITGATVAVIGISLMVVGIKYSAGGVGSPTYGQWQNYALAGLTLVVIIIFNRFGKGFFKAASVLMGMLFSFIIATALGMVDFSSVANASWVSIPQPFKYGLEFKLTPILIVGICYIVAVVEFIGDTTGCAMMAANRQPTQEEYSKGISCDGFSSAIAAMFNFIPAVSYSGNIGLIGVTGVASRYVVGIAGIFITVLGLVPKLSAILTLIPTSIIGGATIVIFGMIATTGIKIINEGDLNERNTLILAISLAVGLGFKFTPGALEAYPFYVAVLLEGIPGTAITGAILNLILPKQKEKSVTEVEDAKVSVNVAE